MDGRPEKKETKYYQKVVAKEIMKETQPLMCETGIVYETERTHYYQPRLHFIHLSSCVTHLII